MALQSTTALATVTLQQPASTVTFSGIPATYRDLIVVISGKLTSDAFWGLRFNNDSTSSYSFVRMYGTGTTTVSDNNTQTEVIVESGLSSDQSHWITQIMDYSATDKHKTVLVRNSQNLVHAVANRWAKTEAINEIRTAGGTWAIGSTFSLYGRIA